MYHGKSPVAVSAKLKVARYLHKFANNKKLGEIIALSSLQKVKRDFFPQVFFKASSNF